MGNITKPANVRDEFASLDMTVAGTPPFTARIRGTSARGIGIAAGSTIAYSGGLDTSDSPFTAGESLTDRSGVSRTIALAGGWYDLEVDVPSGATSVRLYSPTHFSESASLHTLTIITPRTVAFAQTSYSYTINDNVVPPHNFSPAIRATASDNTAVTYKVSDTTNFSIHSTRGILSYIGARLDTINPIPTSFSITVTATAGNVSADVPVTVTVTQVDDPVRFTQTYTFSLNEGVTNAPNVGTVAATDPDNTPITYSLVRPPRGWSIGSTTGIIAFSGTAYDHDVTQSVSLTVQAASGAHTTTTTVTINIVNVNDVDFARPSYTFTVLDSGVPPLTVGTVSATSEDGSTPTYTLQGAGAANFNISVGELSLIQAPGWTLLTRFQRSSLSTPWQRLGPFLRWQTLS